MEVSDIQFALQIRPAFTGRKPQQQQNQTGIGNAYFHLNANNGQIET